MLDTLKRERFILLAAEYDNRDFRGVSLQFAKRIAAVAIGQDEIGDDQVDRLCMHQVQCGAQAIDHGQLDGRVFVAQDRLEETRIARVIFDEKDSELFRALAGLPMINR